ncbi:182 kDa tankyrase-1-binding protein [Sinocyclocheilus grahami]|uniref:Trichohyalin-like n=1 Tax=Sinocyclocheilus grahami TaxID=75366 RepID=A0A672KFL0_SINGR|nr:PREDICTED: trichohyalin-like [Sinocyclocheilus grahami]
MAAWVEATTREMGQSLINPDKPSVSASALPGDTGKPALGPKPHLMPKPFVLQRNASVHLIRAPKTNFSRELNRAASSEVLFDITKPGTGGSKPSESLKSGSNGTVNGSNQSADPKPVSLSQKPDLMAKAKPEPTKTPGSNYQTGLNSKTGVTAEDVKDVQPRSRAKSMGSQDQKILSQKVQGEAAKTEADVKMSSRCWPPRNRLSVELTSKFESPSQPEKEVRRDAETSKMEKDWPPHSPSESRSSKPLMEKGETGDEEVSGGSIKRRISLLFDRSTAAQCRDTFNKRDNPQAEISVDIKQRIQNLSLDAPRTRLPSTGAPKSPPSEKTQSTSDEPPNERSSEKPATTKKVPGDKPASTTEIKNSAASVENVEEEEDDVAIPVGISLDAEKKRREEEEKQRKDEQLEKERQQRERERLLEEEREAREIERQKEEEQERKQEEEKQRQMEERRKQEEEGMRRIEEERKEEERRRQAEKERERWIEEEKRRIQEEKERLREEERLEKLKKEKEMEERKRMEEERQKEEERLRQEREKERLQKEKEMEEERRRIQEMERQREEERLRKEQELERIRKEKEMKEEKQIIQEMERKREEERLRKERELEIIRKEKEMKEEKQRIQEMERQREEERLRKEQELEIIRKEKEMKEEKQRIQEMERQREEERLRKERELEIIRKEKEMKEEKQRIQEMERQKQEERLRQERELERIRKEKEMEEEKQRIQEMERQKQEERLRQERELERIRKEKEMEEEKQRIQEMERQKEEERLRQEREKERLQKEKEMEEERRRIQEMERQKEEERLRKERELERIRKEKKMEEERRIQEMERQKVEERLRQEQELERIRKEKEMEEEKQRIQEMERQKQEEERLRKKQEQEEERRRIQEMERQRTEEKLRQEREIERLQKEREIEERKRMEAERQREEERLRQERERERLKKEKAMEEERQRIQELERQKEDRLRQERENEMEMETCKAAERLREEVPTSYDLISFDAEGPAASQTLVSTVQAADVPPRLTEVIYDDFSVKPRRWGTGARRSSTPSPSREPPAAPDHSLHPEPKSSDPGSQEPCGDQVYVHDLTGFEPEASSPQNSTESRKQTYLFEESKPEDLLEPETQSDEGQLKDGEPEEDAFAEQDTENLIGETDEQNENNDTVDDHATQARINQVLQRLTQARRRNTSTDSDTADVPIQEEPEPLPVLETAAPLPDSRVFRSKVDLGKKRSIKRSRPSRSIRQRVALPSLTEGTQPDWRFCDSTEAKDQWSNGADSESEEEPSQDVTSSPAPSQPKRVPVFPGMDPSALKAQLKRRSGVTETVNPTEAQTPPSVPTRSPRTPTRSFGPRVLPPVDAKDSGSGSSPSWLLELKSKKRMSQPESEA